MAKYTFLDVEIIKTSDGIGMRWYQKECNTEVYCHRRSTVGQKTKINMIEGLMRRIKVLLRKANNTRRPANKKWL